MYYFPYLSLRVNRLTSMASYQAFSIGRNTSLICPHCGSGEETAPHLLLSCSKWAAECQSHLRDYFRTTQIWWIVHIFGTSASLYKRCLTGSSRQHLSLKPVYSHIQHTWQVQATCSELSLFSFSTLMLLLGSLTCKTVSRMTYTVLVETLNPTHSPALCDITDRFWSLRQQSSST